MTEINPVTEPEVMSFAQRIVTTIVSVSQQARDIDSLRHRLDNLSSDFSRLVEENDKLKKEVAETWEFVKTVEAERDQAKRNAELSEARVAEAQQDAARAYVERDTVRTDLNDRIDDIVRSTKAMKDTYEKEAFEMRQALAEANSALTDALAHNASLKATNEEQAFRIVKQGESLMHRQSELDRYAVELHDTHKALDASNNKLFSVEAKLNDLRSLFDSPKEVTATGEENARGQNAGPLYGSF